MSEKIGYENVDPEKLNTAYDGFRSIAMQRLGSLPAAVQQAVWSVTYEVIEDRQTITVFRPAQEAEELHIKVEDRNTQQFTMFSLSEQAMEIAPGTEPLAYRVVENIDHHLSAMGRVRSPTATLELAELPETAPSLGATSAST